jgi:hypothetical protein
MSRPVARLTAWAGLAGGGLLWAINLELGQILPYVDCVRQVRMSAAVSVAAFMLTCLLGVLSWLSARAETRGIASPRTLQFVAAMGALAALVFAFALALQTMASVVLSGCER